MSDIFESKWGETKAALTEGLAGNKKKTMDVILENTKRYLSEQSTAGATSAGNVATLNRVILPVIRRVMPTVIANEIVGVQPMTGPVGQIHTLRIRYADTVASNTTAGEEALSPFKIAKAYSGNQNNTTPKAASTASLEGTPGKRLSQRGGGRGGYRLESRGPLKSVVEGCVGEQLPELRHQVVEGVLEARTPRCHGSVSHRPKSPNGMKHRRNVPSH